MKDGTIWRATVNLGEVNAFSRDSMLDHLGIEFVEVGPDFLKGSMPVDHRTIQPFGILHGGASVVLAETLGSMAANLCIDTDTLVAVGLDVSANHVRQVTGGVVTGTARPIHLGRKTHVWEIKIENESSDLVCVSRLTMIVLKKG